jgi:hypothetical protein
MKWNRRFLMCASYKHVRLQSAKSHYEHGKACTHHLIIINSCNYIAWWSAFCIVVWRWLNYMHRPSVSSSTPWLIPRNILLRVFIFLKGWQKVFHYSLIKEKSHNNSLNKNKERHIRITLPSLQNLNASPRGDPKLSLTFSDLDENNW